MCLYERNEWHSHWAPRLRRRRDPSADHDGRRAIHCPDVMWANPRTSERP